MVTYERAAEAARKYGLLTREWTKFRINGPEIPAIRYMKETDGLAICDALEELDGETIETRAAEVAGALDRVNPGVGNAETDEWKALLKTGRIQPILVNAEANRGLLEKVPHRMIFDLALVYRVVVARDGRGCSTITVQNDNMCGVVTEEELYERAVWGIREDACAFGISGFLRAMFSPDVPLMDKKPLAEVDISQDAGMFVTNRDIKFGAASLVLFERGEVCTDCDMVLLPSSVHELTVLKMVASASPGFFARMVRDANQNEVETHERLGNSVYLYNAKERKLSLLHAGETIVGMPEPESKEIPPFLSGKDGRGGGAAGSGEGLE